MLFYLYVIDISAFMPNVLCVNINIDFTKISWIANQCWSECDVENVIATRNKQKKKVE